MQNTFPVGNITIITLQSTGHNKEKLFTKGMRLFNPVHIALAPEANCFYINWSSIDCWMFLLLYTLSTSHLD